MGCPQPKGSFSSWLLNIAAAERMFNGAVTEAPGTEADGWRGANHLEIGVEREALYLEKREQEDTRAAWWDGLCPWSGRGSSRCTQQHRQPAKDRHKQGNRNREY